MKKYLRTFLISLIICLAFLVIAAGVLFRANGLSIYSPGQARAKFGVSQNDLAIIQNGRPTYVWVVPKAGSILGELRQPAVLIGLIYLPALAISLYEIHRLAGRRNHKIYDLSGDARG